MSYPAQRYFGDTGEVSANYRPATTEPDYFSVPSTADGPNEAAKTTFHYLSTSASTGGEYGLYRVDMGSQAHGPSTHFHKTMSESFFILSGAMRLFDGEHWITATSGDYLYVPVGGLHAFHNASGEPASMLMLFAPGATREEYFENISKLADLTDGERTEFSVRHDSFFL